MDGATAQRFYAQATSIVDFVIKEYGTSRFTDFLRKLRDGYPTPRALSFATGSRIGSLQELETAWLRYMWPSASRGDL